MKTGGLYMEYVTLNNGIKMPMAGFGVFRVPDKKSVRNQSIRLLKLAIA